MPVYVYQEDALDKLIEVEGERWGREVKAGLMRNCDLATLLEAWKVYQVEFPENKDNISPRVALDRGESCIYGSGGYSRYFVKFDGEIVLLAWSADLRGTIDRAKAAGFSIQGTRDT